MCVSRCCFLSSRSCVSVIGCGGVTWDSCTISCILTLSRWSCLQVYQVFANRWASFHTPVMTVVFKLHPEFCRLDTEKGSVTDFDGSCQITWGSFCSLMKLQYEEFRIACTTGSRNLHSDMKDREPGSFHERYIQSDVHVWIKTFIKP
jgi:hypothetical protein